MLAFTDPEDHALMLSDMTQQRNDLKREHHIREIKKLAQRHYGLRVMTIQKHVIKTLEDQLEDVRLEVRNVYSEQNASKDYESKGYMMYLLDMLDFYRKNVDKLKEQLKELDNNIRETYFKLYTKEKEYARKLRKKVRMIPKEKVIDIFESRIERSTYEMGKMTSKNRNFRENIRHMFIVRGNYFSVYQEFIKRNKEDKAIISTHLEKAVTAYRSREDFLYKTGILQERLLADMQKVTANNILLHRIKERDRKAEEFETIKAQERTDCRASQIEESVRKGVTGLEPEVEAAKEMHKRILDASGVSQVDYIRENFQLEESHNFNLFCYINTLHEEIDTLNNQLKFLRSGIADLEENLTADQKHCRRVIAVQRVQLSDISKEVRKAEKQRDSAKGDLESALKLLQGLLNSAHRKKKDQRSSKGEREGELIGEWLTSIETAVAENLMLVEYINYLEVDEKEREKQTEVEKEFDEEEDLESTKSLPSDSIAERAPRLLAECQKQIIRNLAVAFEFLDLDNLRNTATSVIEESSSSEGNVPSTASSSSAAL